MHAVINYNRTEKCCESPGLKQYKTKQPTAFFDSVILDKSTVFLHHKSKKKEKVKKRVQCPSTCWGNLQTYSQAGHSVNVLDSEILLDQ